MYHKIADFFAASNFLKCPNIVYSESTVISIIAYGMGKDL